MIYIEYPKCTTCQKAKKRLDDAGIEYESRNIKENNRKLYSKSGHRKERMIK